MGNEFRLATLPIGPPFELMGGSPTAFILRKDATAMMYTSQLDLCLGAPIFNASVSPQFVPRLVNLSNIPPITHIAKSELGGGCSQASLGSHGAK